MLKLLATTPVADDSRDLVLFLVDDATGLHYVVAGNAKLVEDRPQAVEAAYRGRHEGYRDDLRDIILAIYEKL